MAQKFQINRNGDAPETLVRGHCAVTAAARGLMDALRAVAPHGRNYQFDGGQDIMAQDQREFLSFVGQVQGIEEWAEDSALRAHKQKGVEA